jgi:hypothetical protein
MLSFSFKREVVWILVFSLAPIVAGLVVLIALWLLR